MKGFDNFSSYFDFKNKIEQESNSNVDGYTLAQFMYGTYVFVYGYDFLNRQAHNLPTAQMMEILSFLSCCKEYEDNERDLFIDMCKSLHCQYEALLQYIPMGHRMLKAFIRNWNYEKGNATLFAHQVSTLISFEMYSTDTAADYEYLKSYYELCHKRLKVTAFRERSSEILNKIKNIVSAYSKQLGISDNLDSSNEVRDNGNFLLSWKYVTFTSSAMYLYHPNAPKSSHPFEYKTNDSNSAFNSIKSYFINRLPPIHVKAENRQIIKILDIQNINYCIKKLTDKINLDKQPKTTANHKSLISKKKEVYSKEINNMYKSKYLDWLCLQQSDNYPIFYSPEARINSDCICTYEDAFIFVQRTGMRQMTIVYENTNDSRCTFVFKVEKAKLSETIEEIHELFVSNTVNKREQITNGRMDSCLFAPGQYCRVLHTDFESWKEKLMTL